MPNDIGTGNDLEAEPAITHYLLSPFKDRSLMFRWFFVTTLH